MLNLKHCNSWANKFTVGSYHQNWNMNICSDLSFQMQQKEQTDELSLFYTLKSRNFLPHVIALPDLISDGSHAVFHRSEISKLAFWWVRGSLAIITKPALLPTSVCFLLYCFIFFTDA